MSSVKDLLRGDVVDGSGTANYVSKWSDADTITNSVIYDNGTNVGIGTSSPTEKFVVSNNGGYGLEISPFEGGNNVRLMALDRGTITRVPMSFDANEFVFQKNTSTELVRIDSSGNVGIGTSSPAEKLHAYNASGNIFGLIQSASSGVAGLKLQSAVGLSTIYTGVGSAQGFQFYANGSSEAMRITSDGWVLIGTTSIPDGTTGGTAFIDGTADRNYLRLATTSTVTRGHILFVNPNGTVGTISTLNSSTIYSTSSDYRLKENVTPIQGALDRVDALKPSRFNFIADPEITVDGFLAHEVQAIVPEAVTGEKDEVDEEGNPVYQGIDQSKLVPLLVGAIQELKAEIETLKSQINV